MVRILLCPKLTYSILFEALYILHIVGNCIHMHVYVYKTCTHLNLDCPNLLTGQEFDFPLNCTYIGI